VVQKVMSLVATLNLKVPHKLPPKSARSIGNECL